MKKNMSFALIFILGVAGGGVRALEVMNVFDPVTGLAEPQHPYTIALYALTLLAAIIILAAAWHMPTAGFAGYNEAFKTPSGEYFLIFAIAAAFLILSALAGISDFVRMSRNGFGFAASVFILSVLALICAAAILYIAGKTCRSADSNLTGTWTLVPIVYSCFLLIVTFSERAADPVILDYIYELFAAVSVTLAFYYGAGFAFGNSKVKRTVIFSLLAFYFSLISLVGPAITAYLSKDALNLNALFKAFTYAFATINFFAYAKILNTNAGLAVRRQGKGS